MLWSPGAGDPLVDAVHAATGLADHCADRPLEWLRWTRPQLRWLKSKHARKLLRAGNQIGKTTVGLAEVIWRATGTHPYLPTHKPPVDIWILCTTWPQSVAIMRKFWALLPKHLIHPVNFTTRYGFGKDNPAVTFLNGSIVRFRTTNQGAEAMAGDTVHYVLVDEPTDEEIYRELDRRLMRTAGSMGLVLTPVNRPVEYLRQLCRDGMVEDHHARLDVENLIPEGAREPLRLLDGTPMDELWIAEQRRLVLKRWQPVVLDGEWECRVEGSVFEAYNPELHFTEAVPQIDLLVCLGLDWGEGNFRQVHEIAGIDLSGDHARVHFLGEYTSDGTTLPEQDALGTIEALEEAGGWVWREVHSAVGDKPTIGKIGRKSNKDMMAALERELRRRGELDKRAPLTPQIKTAKTGKGGGSGSVWRGVEWLHRAMLRPGHFSVHHRCERLHESLQKWDFSDSEWKDACDAARYATWPFAMRGWKGAGSVPVHLAA